MAEHTTDTNRKDKEKIRARYKGMPPEALEVIPAIEEADFYDDERPRRVAVYARVSTDDPRQTSSLELQKNHYEDYVRQRKSWNLVKLYVDDGVSGTSLRHRDAFNQMIRDCEEGKIDLVVTKSVSRFSRNIYDCIGCVRKLAALHPPVGVFFEAEHLYTLNRDCEVSLSLMATVAQEESRSKSNSMNFSYEMRFRRGVFLTPALLGYDVNEEGDLVINEAEAETVRLIFFMYLFGHSCQQIADTLTRLSRQTKKGNEVWSAGMVLNVLQNERHCGDVLARKTWTPNYLDHKVKKNVNNRNQYRKKDHHEAIISRDDYIAAQRLMMNAKYGYKGVLPTLHVLERGILRGFVIVNTRWAGFGKEDYMEASRSAAAARGSAEVQSLLPETGDFDLREYEVVRTQFLGSFRGECVTFSVSKLVFSAACVQRLERTAYIELLWNPQDQVIAIRPAAKDQRSAVQWAKIRGDRFLPREIGAICFLGVLFDMMGWDTDCKYRVRGVRKQIETEMIMLFDLRDMEIIIPAFPSEDKGPNSGGAAVSEMTPLTAHTKKSIVAFPAAWAHTFGHKYYESKQAQKPYALDSGDIAGAGRPFVREGEGLQNTSCDDLSRHITSLMESMRQEESLDE